MTSIVSRWSKVATTAVAWADETRALVGSGQHVLLVDVLTGQLEARVQVFRAAVVHSLENIREGDMWVVRGGKSLAVISVREEVEVVVEEIQTDDWIIASAVEEKEGEEEEDQDQVLVLTAHNKVLRCGLQSAARTSQTVMEPESGPCILYSGLILPSHRLVMSGTVWGRLLVWSLTSGQVLHSLAGHDGVIFSVNHSRDTLATSSDDRSVILYQVSPAFSEVRQVRRLWAHTGRVFRVLVSPDLPLVLTAGEDGRLITWSQTGAQLETLETGCPVWSLAGRASSVLVGAADGSLTGLSLTTDQGEGEGRRSAERLECGLTSPRTVLSLEEGGRGRVLVQGDGRLVSYDLTSSTARTLYSNPDLATYCLLALSGDHLVMAGLEGLVVSAGLQQDQLTNIKTRRVMEGKIFSCGVFSVGGETRAVVCDGEGRLTVLDTELTSLAQGELPAMRERWFTASCGWGPYYVLGDRTGGLHLLQLSGAQLSSVQTWPRLHGRHGVTQVLVDPGDPDLLWSSGRDGTVRCFSLKSDRRTVSLVGSVRPGLDWVGGLVSWTGGQLAVLLWRGAELQLRTLGGDGLLGSAQCGGGHRSWGLLTGSGSVVYIKEGSVLVSPLCRGDSRVIVAGHHTQQVNVVRAVLDLVITGSEDTTVRVWREGSQLAVIRGHLSSVKCIKARLEPAGSVLLVTGGGRGELRLWRLVVVRGQVFCSAVARHTVRQDQKGRKKAWKAAQSCRPSEGETRLMSVDTEDSEDSEDSEVTVWAACSDGALREYSYSESQAGGRLELGREGEEVSSHCLQEVRTLGPGRLVTTDTGGQLTVWSRADLSVTGQVRPHQSGVNCLELRRDSHHSWLVVTGGDDTSLVVTRYQELQDLQDQGRTQLDIIWRSDSGAGHTTQLTGLRLVGDLLVSAGVDQRLVVWSLARGGGLTWLASKCVSVADISGLDCWQEGGRLHCVLAGVGLEILDILTPSRPVLS